MPIPAAITIIGPRMAAMLKIPESASAMIKSPPAAISAVPARTAGPMVMRPAKRPAISEVVAKAPTPASVYHP